MQKHLVAAQERLRRLAGPEYTLCRQLMVRGASQFAVPKPITLSSATSRLPAMRVAAGPLTDSLKIRATPVPYNRLSCDLGGFKEVYAPGCFAGSLDDGDLRVCLNHNSAHILGRKSAGTATFWEDRVGVHFEADPPETSWADDLLVSMDRGDINQASAAFYILQHRWETRSGERIRVVERACMMESSIVSFPAYESTSAAIVRPQDQSLAAGSFYLPSSTQKGSSVIQ